MQDSAIVKWNNNRKLHVIYPTMWPLMSDDLECTLSHVSLLHLIFLTSRKWHSGNLSLQYTSAVNSLHAILVVILDATKNKQGAMNQNMHHFNNKWQYFSRMPHLYTRWQFMQ